MARIQNVYYVKINLCITNVNDMSKMSEKTFVTKSFKVLFYTRVSLSCLILFH